LGKRISKKNSDRPTNWPIKDESMHPQLINMDMPESITLNIFSIIICKGKHNIGTLSLVINTRDSKNNFKK
jgi:hypothetical protein